MTETLFSSVSMQPLKGVLFAVVGLSTQLLTSLCWRAGACVRGGANLNILLQRGPKKDEAKHIYGNWPSVEGLLKSRKWDYVLMNDFSQAPAIPASREETLTLLRAQPEKGALRLLLEKCGGIPVVYQTWGYRAAVKDSEKIGAFPEMSQQIAAGCDKYRAALGSQALLSPVGTAFEIVHAERGELWQELYHSDDYHPSCLGTYLAAATIYATVVGQTLQSASLNPFQEGLCAAAVVSRAPTLPERCLVLPWRHDFNQLLPYTDICNTAFLSCLEALVSLPHSHTMESPPMPGGIDSSLSAHSP